MKRSFLLITLISLLVFFGCGSDKREGDPQVLVFSKTAGFRHASIPKGIAAIQKLGAENNFKVDATENAAVFSSDSLNKYAAIIFLSTTGNVLDASEEAGFERYIQAGGGFVGVHAATDTEYDWNWYGKLVGAYFTSHPAIQKADFKVKNTDFPATEFLKDSIWQRTDELYNFKKINPDINVLLEIDEKSYDGGTNGAYHPMSWYHEYDGGRSFYTELGHTDESFVDPNYLKHLMGGIKYAMGDNEKLNYDKAVTQIPPDADRFTKNQLSQGEFFEPTEMTILPNYDVLVAQRRGELMLYKDETKKISQVGFLDVYHKTLNTPGVNAEEGIMGLQKDPDFEKNHWIYMYYAPTGDQWINRLSRFKFENDELKKETEQIIIEIDTQREICCHTGGSIAFGPDGLLYLSTGDNSTPFNEKEADYVNNGFAPLNDTPDHKQFDARRSSANTNDLRGKILRLKINEDGSYDIPEGNLFKKGTEKTRPEIYTMGHRNPYRISVDQKNSNLYWGEVGPDANEDSLATRGPKGYDEMNQAQKAGNFGWPLVIADNKPYREYDYATGESGELYDPEHPMNNSKNNTGLTELPPAQPAYVFYPYDATGEFPQVGQGGRNAMAGPVYYSDMFPKENALPSYFDGKVIIYDWMRGWMMAASFFPNGDFNKMEPFAANVKLNSLIDMEVAPDGRIYLLEYGSGWFSKNDDSGLARIEYNGGNRPPLVSDLKVDKTSGGLPLQIKASVTARDREKDALTYVWHLGENETKETTEPQIEYTFKDAGSYTVSVEVRDDKKANAISETVSVVAGNTRPEVSIKINRGNKAFFMPGVPLDYEILVEDVEDGTAINEENIFVSVDYMEGMDGASIARGHQEGDASIMGKTLTETLDCRSCHKVGEKSIGPSYNQVAERYKNDENVFSYLTKKIMAGGAGAWGEVMMPAHPTLTDAETKQIVSYIVSLSDNTVKKKSLPRTGTITPKDADAGKTMVLVASYTDKGSSSSRPLTGTAQKVLPGSMLKINEDMEKDGFSQIEYNGNKMLIAPQKQGWFALPDIDLTGVRNVSLNVSWREEMNSSLRYEVHLDSENGKVIGMGTMKKPGTAQTNGSIDIPLEKIDGEEFHKLYFTYLPTTEAVKSPSYAVLAINFKGN
ncbi:ThuA domain-containing protein [Flavimarina sp. Hel_I_48]|uniref:ThuA domain-containing protein n=1 Tax=Flavimarina sp. Hel_I_48 TaxID=1392488 RepID=UPI0004DF0CB6|nr:ThuA domain-containing protein [Flavimarina sp. Hel_I_48]